MSSSYQSKMQYDPMKKKHYLANYEKSKIKCKVQIWTELGSTQPQLVSYFIQMYLI